MDICIVGKGGREHALAAACERHGHKVKVAPGNPGIPNSTEISPLFLEADLFVIGPEAELVDGLADRLRDQGKTVFGPGKAAARLEGSKAWMKNVAKQARIPTARFFIVDNLSHGLDVIKKEFNWRAAIKTDGLAAGKGVTIVNGPEDEAIARRDISDKLKGIAFGDAGKTLVIEELLEGREVSMFAICNGRDYVVIDAACDYKRLLDGDKGPMTGGMGSYSPAGTEDQHGAWGELFIRPLLDWYAERDIEYRGVIFVGLMLTTDGPKLLEYNIRFGDPEIQSIAPRFTSDPAELLLQAAQGKPMESPTFTQDVAVTVVLASEQYPESMLRQELIDDLNIQRHHIHGDVYLTYAGVTEARHRLFTDGGRVMAVTALAATRELARELAYDTVPAITWHGKQYRTDIAAD